jgi:4-amino-4-deoxy-L-arabinose transferase-like glycosyltransferase
MKWGKEESFGKKTAYLILSGIFMSLGYMLRMNNLIFIIAIAIYMFLVLLNMKEKKEILYGIICFIVFLELAFIPANTIKNYYSNKLSLKKESIYPVTGFLYMGMMESTRANGWYNDKHSQYGLNSDDAGPLYKDLIKERVKEFIKNPSSAIVFYGKKTYSMWCENTYQSVYHNRNIYSNVYDLKNAPEEYDAFFTKYEIPIIIFSKAVSLLIFGFALAAAIKNKNNLSNEFILLLTVFIGGFLFHTIWEAKSRYILSYVVVLIPLASIVVLPKLNELKKNKEESNGDY